MARSTPKRMQQELDEAIQSAEALSPAREDLELAKALTEYRRARGDFEHDYRGRNQRVAVACKKYLESLPSFRKHAADVSVRFSDWSGYIITLVPRVERSHTTIVSVQETLSIETRWPSDVVPMAKALLAYSISRGVDPDGALRAITAARSKTTRGHRVEDAAAALAAPQHPDAKCAALRQALVGRLVAQFHRDRYNTYAYRTPIRVSDVQGDYSSGSLRVLLIGSVLSDADESRQPWVQVEACQCVLVDGDRYAATGEVTQLRDAEGRPQVMPW